VPKTTKILVVDDQPVVRRTLRSLLAEKSHWKIYEAENGKVALECIQKENPQVAVLDIVMPEMGGIETAYEIRQLAPETKIILISSHLHARGSGMSSSPIRRWELHSEIGNWRAIDSSLSVVSFQRKVRHNDDKAPHRMTQ
jgi:chemotaxis response regulator CheB